MNPILTHGLATDRHRGLTGRDGHRPGSGPAQRPAASAPVRRRLGLLLLATGLRLLTNEREQLRRSTAPLVG